MAGIMAENTEVIAALYHLLWLAILLVFLSITYKAVVRFVFTYRIRQRYNDIPHLPRHWLAGNLVNVGERLSPSINAHPDNAMQEIWDELGQPPAYMIDLAPVDRAMMIIADPTIAEAITQPSPEYKYSIPKSNTLQQITRLVGDHSLVLIEGEEWRIQRRRFNKGFAPTHLNTLIPFVVSKTRVFLDRLKGYAQNGEDFQLKDPASDLTTDIITQLAIEKDFQAQTVPEGQGPKSTFGLLTSIKTMSSLTEKTGQGFDISGYIHPERKAKEWIYDRLYTKAIYNEIINKLPSIKQERSTSGKKPSTVSSAKAIVNLALTGLDPTPSVLNSTVSQVKTFLFAGQDTTSTLIQWMALELSKSYPSSPLYSDHHKQIREHLCAEHDAVFGSSDPFAALDVLSREDAHADELLGSKLPYTTAFIKEALRLNPPGGSARLIPLSPYDPDYPNQKSQQPHFIDLPAWTHSKTGEHHEARRIRVDGMRLYNTHFIIHRNPNTWGPDAAEFDPSRFLDRSGKASVDEVEEAMNTHKHNTPHGNGSTSPRTTKSATKTAQTDLPHPYHISTLPTGSYRPFERGPRTCIGSNLAYIEAKIVLAIMARGFEWTKVGLDGTRPKPEEVVYGGTGKEDVKVGESQGWRVWSINQVTSVPVDGMRMRIKLRR
ncbi:hypothetical protein LTR70_008704 [Exophiala xenobiotica]|uniref:Cytochrome P450 n=1 Tax=Lithohypha guttulata TaxID=1690604 RepID=A0ABR0K3L4_9EURO|nr:hypothetical protein LTR24_007206 [Lithohypha guttulata]KAK5311607.1 hypothetical protein LTR70_008704 [Exophiala xenobiotica]